MPKLISRQKYIPGSFKFWQPEIKFQAPPNASFDIIVQAIIAARKANPHLLQKYGWSTDYNAVADELDFFNASICKQMGWTDYITEGGGGATVPFTVPPPPRSTLQRVAGVKAGAETIVEWIKSKEEAVPQELANKRAWTCAVREDGKGCPLNQRGDWTRFFTVPAAEAFRKLFELRHQIQLSTQEDEKLGVCGACDCPLKLKVHLPLARIVSKMPQDVQASLDKGCWILSESKA